VISLSFKHGSKRQTTQQKEKNKENKTRREDMEYVRLVLFEKVRDGFEILFDCWRDVDKKAVRIARHGNCFLFAEFVKEGMD
jgi:hypothetical protein